MVGFHGLHDPFGNAPEGQEVRSDLSVRRGENTFFGLIQGNADFLDEVEHEFIFALRIGGEDEFAYIVQQSREETFLRQFGREALGYSQFACTYRGAETMSPKMLERLAREGLVIIEIEGLDSQNQRAKYIDSNDLHRLDWRDDTS